MISIIATSRSLPTTSTTYRQTVIKSIKIRNHIFKHRFRPSMLRAAMLVDQSVEFDDACADLAVAFERRIVEGHRVQVARQKCGVAGAVHTCRDVAVVFWDEDGYLYQWWPHILSWLNSCNYLTQSPPLTTALLPRPPASIIISIIRNNNNNKHHRKQQLLNLTNLPTSKPQSQPSTGQIKLVARYKATPLAHNTHNSTHSSWILYHHHAYWH